VTGGAALRADQGDTTMVKEFRPSL